MRRSQTGRYEVTTVAGETVRAFVPFPIPPDPGLDLTSLQQPIERAVLALGRLDSISTLLPDPHLFLYTYVRKEAVLSSQIEGTQSSLSDLLLFELEEIPGVPMDDVVEVSRYVAALEHGVERLRDGFPLSNRLIRDMHAILLESGRGSSMTSGEFRRTQNWIGGSRPGNAHFVPPPPLAVPDCMSELERFLHSDVTGIGSIVRAGLAHVQFETIHPFLDGNGRIGRLLITLLLFVDRILSSPLLYLSLFLRQHRDEYYRLLDGVRRDGDWEAWLDFFLQGVTETASSAVDTAHRLVSMFAEDQERIQTVGRSAGSLLRVHQVLKERAVVTIPTVCESAGLSFPAVSSSLGRLADLDIVHEITGRRRNRVFVYHEYLAVLNEGTYLEANSS